MSGGTAVLLDAPGTVRLAPHTPRPPGPGEAQVRVHAAGICGSDRELYLGSRPAPYARYPVTPGHEWSGTVAEVGAGVPEPLAGRKVVGEGFRNCQVCARCRTGETTLCAAGYAETGFTEPGAMAPTLTLPARLLHLLPDEADLDAAALLEPAACVAAAALRAGVRPGDRVAVVGDGTLGMLALGLLAAGSPAELLATGARPERAALATAFGATGYRHHQETDGLGGYDVVVEAAGAAGSARQAAGLLRRGGRLVLTGLPPAAGPGLDPAALVLAQTEVRTVFGAPPAAWAHAVRAFACGLLDPLPLVTHRMPLRDYEKAVALAGDGGPAVGKVLLHP
ncbi:alcohol dehydrogenase catalytic domain-containing protein [Streptomyces tubbatahanensis]|uniref:2-deoxy-scyllo-inosamine dehydrogenase n=1 Tax=Streptomyces tubbatahanensis TaxID=2923272 RepID=A0ABY3XP04_9ACTN|nr:alcohol dehydrogenase catalytic domain-containing protein [Streptomyces tubbatahanensis]UNS96149.1 alcohol dehydrogenase catalytic domain-containing protein [Streptomyces tubbatahanensis]